MPSQLFFVTNRWLFSHAGVSHLLFFRSGTFVVIISLHPDDTAPWQVHSEHDRLLPMLVDLESL